MWYELFIFLKWVEKNSYLNGLMEVFFCQNFYASPICVEVSTICYLFQSDGGLLYQIFSTFFEDTFWTRLIESQYHVVLTHLHVSQTKVLQHTCVQGENANAEIRQSFWTEIKERESFPRQRKCPSG